MSNLFAFTKAPSSSLLSKYSVEKSYIFIGTEFLFSNRLYFNLKRKLSIIPFELSTYVLNGMNPFSLRELFALIKYKKIDSIIFSSETLFFCCNEFICKFFFLLNGDEDLQSIDIIFCDITHPAPPKYLFSCTDIEATFVEQYSILHSLNRLVRQSLSGDKNLVFEFSSYIPSGFSLWQENFLASSLESYFLATLLRQCMPDQLKFYCCEELSFLLMDYMFSEGTLSIKNSRSCLSLDDICNATQYQAEIRSQLPISTSLSEFCTNLNLDHRIAPPLLSAFPRTYCALNIVYRNRPIDVPAFSRVITASTRISLGLQLGKTLPSSIARDLDFICPIPETGKYYAQGLAQSLDIPYIEALIKSKDIGRSFDIQNTGHRRDFIQKKLAVIPELLDGKNVGFVDEAIFTGSTLKIVSELVSSTNIKSVYFLIPTPECKQRCEFNMQPERNILSEYVRCESLAAYFDVDGVFFQEQAAFIEIILNDHGKLCTQCFSD